MLFFFGMGSVTPILSPFVKNELAGSDTTVGVVIGSFAVSSLVLRAWFGRLGDRRGARLLMIVGCLVGAAGMGVQLFAASLPVVIVSRLLLGAAQAAVMTGSTTLAIDLSPVERRGEASSYILVAFHIGLGLGPVIGEFVLHHSSYDGVWLMIGVLMLGGALVATLLPRRGGVPDAPPSPLFHPNGVMPGIVIAIGMMSFISFSSFVPLYGEELGLAGVGLVFTLASVGIALVRLLGGKLPDLLGPITSSTVALVAILGGTMVLSAWHAVPGLYLGVVVVACGGALLMPALIPLVVDGVEPHRRSSAMATFTMFIDVAVAVTGYMFGVVADLGGYRATFVAGGVTAVVGLVVLRVALAPRAYHRREAESAA